MEAKMTFGKVTITIKSAPGVSRAALRVDRGVGDDVIVIELDQRAVAVMSELLQTTATNMEES